MTHDQPMSPPLALPSSLAQLHAVRHGQSTANTIFAQAQQRLPGRDADVKLSRMGAIQARAAGRWLSAFPPEQGPHTVVVSPYLRAHETWDLMAEQAMQHGRQTPVAWSDERLRDREMGVLELMPPAAIRREQPREAERRSDLGEWAYRPPGGESLADVALRVRDFLVQLDATLPGRSVLLVAHDAVVIALRYVLTGLGAPVPGHDTAVPNASVTTWQGNGHHLALTSWAATDHLTDVHPPATRSPTDG
ncbi:histidine phosphatase family protein [Streptomyces sp. NBC_00470]|uniref:histidine phosphatase family protein n=1 Tax=Streptomyces sp. NBC_00470 TaxID=2975753 RepID=UPI002F9152F8